MAYQERWRWNARDFELDKQERLEELHRKSQELERDKEQGKIDDFTYQIESGRIQLKIQNVINSDI